MTTAALVAFALLAGSQSPELPPPAKCRLTAIELDEAVRAGSSGTPKPVSIGFKMTIGGRVATLYTPRKRVQLVAHAARLAYKPFVAADVTQDVCQDVTVVAARPWLRNSVVAVVLLPKGSKNPADAIQPVWTRPYAIAAPAVYGTIGLGFGRAVLAQTFAIEPEEMIQGLVAAFAPAEFTEDREIAFVYDGRFNKQRGLGRTNENRFDVRSDWK